MQKRFKLGAVVVLLGAGLFSSITYATSPQVAAQAVVAKSSMDGKCQAFFDYYMEYAVVEDYSGMDDLIAAIDRQDTSLVDYCDSRRDRYLSKYR
ncbi:hypothetical protein QWY79_14060 [Halomonas sabkhae]|uniref:hypothetical protein n=1 Tax=Halomonas sabkhae TaxID=626223 RepID=UPI0025B529BB|nr:hypothetical protein [Halomonas sabkhae]MDN3526392.1 hypothetical protein [Halomonas sabkhae]